MDRLTYFAGLAAAEPNEPRARYGYATELFRNEDWDGAAREFTAYLSLADDEGSAWGRLAECLHHLGRDDEAADAYLAGIDRSLINGHHGMADDFQAALDAL